MPRKTTSWRTNARRRWAPLYILLGGDGQYAVVAACSTRIAATLYPTLEQARQGLASLDKRRCCGGCHQNHWIEDLGIKERNWNNLFNTGGAVTDSSEQECQTGSTDDGANNGGPHTC